MKNILILFILFTSIIKAQETNFSAIVKYNYGLERSITTMPYQVNSKLTYNTIESIYEMDHLNSFDTSDKVIKTEKKLIFGIKAKENEFVYKNFNENSINYSNKISMKKFNIKSKLDTLMNWSLSSETKIILGYTCQKAATEYGGRYYVAYFTNEIAVPNGPWRFHGLPGLILEVKSTDNVFKIEATSIEIKNTNLLISNPFKDKKLITWDKFLSLYRKKYDEVRRNSMKEWGPSQTLAKKGIVEYIKD